MRFAGTQLSDGKAWCELMQFAVIISCRRAVSNRFQKDLAGQERMNRCTLISADCIATPHAPDERCVHITVLNSLRRYIHKKSAQLKSPLYFVAKTSRMAERGNRGFLVAGTGGLVGAQEDITCLEKPNRSNKVASPENESRLPLNPKQITPFGHPEALATKNQRELSRAEFS